MLKMVYEKEERKVVKGNGVSEVILTTFDDYNVVNCRYK